MIALEARSRAFNVQPAGGVNLACDARNGRNFECLGEDPLLGAVLCAASWALPRPGEWGTPLRCDLLSRID
jgi:beta-glucosidase-like glycosyl hydrolase